MQQADDPPYLTVGTEVSAKYKGAFCEAKVRKVVRNIKCRVAYKQAGLGSGVVSDDQIKGALRVGATVEVKHPERKEYVEATLTKIQDCSQYTVVFDDGDITTLRRSALCLKSGRHFNESETLDQLPLTHPEHFGNPVIGGRRGRRSRHLLQDDSSDEDDEPAQNSRSNNSDKEENIGKVVCVESTDNKKKNPKENWFPGLVVAPTAQDTVRIRVKDEYLVRSFKDGRYYTVPKKEATDFNRDCTNKSEAAAVSAALDYMDNDTLPPHWDREALFGMSGSCSDSEQELETDSSDDEPTEEKDHFVAQLYKFMDDRGTPLNKVPSIINRDVNLYRLFRAVQKLNGYNRVTSQNQWKQIALRLGFSPATVSITNLVKQAYKKFLFSFEEFNRKLGCTMVPHPRTNRSKGRSLVRASSVQSPKTTEKEKPSTSKAAATAAAAAAAAAAATAAAAAEAASSSASVEESGNTSESSTAETKPSNKRKLSGANTGKVKALVDKFEEKEKDKEKEKEKEKPKETVAVKKEEPPTPSTKKEKIVPKPTTPKATEIITEKRGRKRKETDSTDSKKEDKDSGKGSSASSSGASSSSVSVTSSADSKSNSNSSSSSNSSSATEAKPVAPAAVTAAVAAGSATTTPSFPIDVGDKLKVYYDEQKVTYEAKVIEIAIQEGSPIYLVHYTGWNTRYDEWVRKERVAENLTNSKTKKGKSDKSHGNKNAPPPRDSSSSSTGGPPGSSAGNSTGPPSSTTAPSSAATTPKTSKRIRGNSRGDMSGNTPTTPVTTSSPRSTTPSASAARNKSPASAGSRRPVTRGGQPNASSRRRTSNNTDISSLSLQTDDNTSDTDSDEPIKKCPANTNSNSSSSTASSNSSSSSSASSSSSISSSSTKVSTTAEAGSSSDAAAISDEFSNGASKGRDYDLNQIRSELKGFKELKSPTSPASDTTTTATTDAPGTQGQTLDIKDAKDSIPDGSSTPPRDDEAVPASSKSDGTPLKDELDEPMEEDHEKTSESETLSEEDSSQSSNKAFSSSPITAMVDSDTAPETPIPPPTVSTPTPTVITTQLTSVSSTSNTTVGMALKTIKTIDTCTSKIIDKVVEKTYEKDKAANATPSSAPSSGMPHKPPLKTYGTAAAIIANAENNAVKYAVSTIIRETDVDKLFPLGSTAAGPSTSGVAPVAVKEVPTPVITKPSHLLPEDKPAIAPVPPSQPTQRPNNPPAFSSNTTPAPTGTVQPPPPKSSKMINVQDEIVATVINKSAIAAATTATAVSAAVSSTIPGTTGISLPSTVGVNPVTTAPSTSTTTLAALRAEKKLTGDKRVEKVIPMGKLGVSDRYQPSVLSTEKKLSSSTLTPAQNKLLSKEALSIKSIFESTATKIEKNISDVYEFKDVEFDVPEKTTTTPIISSSSSSVSGTTPRKHVSDVPPAEMVSSVAPLSEEKKTVGKKGLVRKPELVGLAEKKVKKISPMKETDKLKLVRREKERDLEKEKLRLNNELEGAVATFSAIMATPERSSPHFTGFSMQTDSHTFDVFKKSSNVSTVSHRDEKPVIEEDHKPEASKLAAVTKGIFTPVMSPTGPEPSFSEVIKSPSKLEDKVKEEPTLENCKKYFNDMNFDFDTPKTEKPPSIADKVLKALGQQPQVHCSSVKSDFPKYSIPTTVHHKHPSLMPIEPLSSSPTVVMTTPAKLEISSFASTITMKPHHTQPPKIEVPSIILKKEVELVKPSSIPIVCAKAPPMFTSNPDILPPTTCTKSQDLTESIKKLETSNLVQAESSRFTHHDEDSTDSNDSEHRLVIEDPEAIDPIPQQTDFEKLIKVEVEEKPPIPMSHVEMHSAASAAAVAAVACKEKLIYKTEPHHHHHQDTKEEVPSLYGLVDSKKGKQPSILETIIQCELNTVVKSGGAGMGSHSFLKIKDHDSFAQNELDRLRREELLLQQQPSSHTTQPNPSLAAPLSESPMTSPTTMTAPTATSDKQQSTNSESLSMLLCEETIPGSPAPVCGVSSASAQKESTKVYAEAVTSFLSPQNIASDLKPVPMDLEPTTDPLAMTTPAGRKSTAADTTATDTPNSSPRDSISQDENQEPEVSPTKKRRQRKTSEEPTNKRRRTTGCSGSYGRGSHRSMGNNATDSEDNSDSMAFHRGGHISSATGGSSSASPGGKSGRPCQYNFLVNLDPALNSAQRIAILKKKIQELRKTYNAIKAELASIDRRRKKLRRRERENKKQAKLAAGGGTC